MDKHVIEHLVCSRIKEAAEAAAEACILEINAAGYEFRRDPDALFAWRDVVSGRLLSVTCILGVSLQTAEEAVRPADPDKPEREPRIPPGQRRPRNGARG